jgi:hypothetical protein
VNAIETVISKDGSRIAYDRLGSGPTVILVAGALGYRTFNKMQELAKLLRNLPLLREALAKLAERVNHFVAGTRHDLVVTGKELSRTPFWPDIAMRECNAFVM